MKKLLIAGTIASLATLTIATSVGHDSLLAAFASNDIIMQGVRIALIGLLAALLITSPPRSLHFRTILGAVSAALSFGVVLMLERYAIGFLDAVFFIEVAIIFALESIETTEVVKPAKAKGPVVYSATGEKILI